MGVWVYEMTPFMFCYITGQRVLFWSIREQETSEFAGATSQLQCWPHFTTLFRQMVFLSFSCKERKFSGAKTDILFVK